ncbi:MAG: PEP-utilizing enzyme [Cellvibrionales bacterium]|nr:PEP-utilizing enzyme [Cellvibrionales bacterium]
MNKYLSLSGPLDLHNINAHRLRAEFIGEVNAVDHAISAIADLKQGDCMYISTGALLIETPNQDLTCEVGITLYESGVSALSDSADFIIGLLDALNVDTDINARHVGLICITHKVGEDVRQGKKTALHCSSLLAEKLIFADSVAPVALSTKARTLAFFHGLIDAFIDPGIIVDYPGWRQSPDTYLEAIIKKQWPTCISRSSSKSEDSFTCSNAGAFESVPNVDAMDKLAIQAAINTTFDSYVNQTDLDEVLVQRQVDQVLLSGVCTTRVLGNNAPYYVISYDDTSGRTDSITAGDTNTIKTLYFRRNAQVEKADLPNELKKVIVQVQAIEQIVPGIALDIEFLVGLDNALTILQIRPLVGRYSDEDDTLLFNRIEQAKTLYQSYQFNHDGRNQGGNKGIFGVMPDANPAELIGIKPKPLAFSLYKYLITDTIVTEQRFEYGYRDVRPRRHMINFGGSPYVDVKSSFNSFTPASLSDEIANRLINLYLSRLASDKTLHDKVEFDVVATTWFPGVGEWFASHYGEALDSSTITDVVDALKGIFMNAINSTASYSEDVERYQYLFDKIESSDLSDLQKGCTLIDVCHHYGCKPFAHLARSAFVAVSVLKGLCHIGILSKDQYNLYLQSVMSVSSQMEKEAYDVKIGKLSRIEFYKRYGHLRPGTYDISNAAYFEDLHQYLDPIIESAEPCEITKFALPEATSQSITSYFQDHNLNMTFEEFDTFARKAISGRELGKFRYTKFLSHGMNHLIKWGNSEGISRDDLAYLSIFDYHAIVTGDFGGDKASMIALIEKRKVEHDYNSRILLPDVISSMSDFDYFYKSVDKPNYITGLNTESDLVVITSEVSDVDLDLSGKVILVDSADPGYDWLFGRSISGLITRYGGANSHMAIRCAELKVPAAIGIGDAMHELISGFKRIRLDCMNESITEC